LPDGQLAPLNALMHRVEEIFSRLRAHPEQYFPELGEFLLLATDEIEQLLTELISEGVGDEHRRARLALVCDNLQKSTVNGLKLEHFRAAIEALGGRATDKGDAQKNERVELPLPPDLALMQQWSSYIDNLSIFRKNRSTQTAQLTEALNQAVGQIVDPVQLQAAALMHDMGMAFIPHAIFNKEGHLSREEQRIIQEHVRLGHQMLQRFSGWDEAARMVLDHHDPTMAPATRIVYPENKFIRGHAYWQSSIPFVLSPPNAQIAAIKKFAECDFRNQCQHRSAVRSQTGQCVQRCRARPDDEAELSRTYIINRDEFESRHFRQYAIWYAISVWLQLDDISFPNLLLSRQ
jgi:chemotaxis protein histidine kinase CheA